MECYAAMKRGEYLSMPVYSLTRKAVHNTLLRAKWQVENHGVYLQVPISPHIIVQRDMLGRMLIQKLVVVVFGRKDFKIFILSSLCLYF